MCVQSADPLLKITSSAVELSVQGAVKNATMGCTTQVWLLLRNKATTTNSRVIPSMSCYPFIKLFHSRRKPDIEPQCCVEVGEKRRLVEG